jgi:DNA ligase (NAD+)
MPRTAAISDSVTGQLGLEDARREHAALGAEIAEHDRRYHGEDAPVISDADYDALRRRYEALEDRFPELATPESLTRKVGAQPSEKFAKVRHRVPMLSLANAFADEAVGRVRRAHPALSSSSGPRCR